MMQGRRREGRGGKEGGSGRERGGGKGVKGRLSRNRGKEGRGKKDGYYNCVFHVTNSSQLTRVMITRRKGEREPNSGGRSGNCVRYIEHSGGDVGSL